MVATNPVTFITVYQYETREGDALPHVYLTRDTIAGKGGRIVKSSAREVPGCEVSDYGLWTPHRSGSSVDTRTGRRGVPQVG